MLLSDYSLAFSMAPLPVVFATFAHRLYLLAFLEQEAAKLVNVAWGIDEDSLHLLAEL